MSMQTDQHSTSLNAGSELDDELVSMLGEELPGVPEEQEDEEAYIALESRIQEMIDLTDDVSQSKGMSQRFALEALRILPDVLSLPVNYFTKAPSATSFKIAMEEIHHGIWALIAAATVAVIAAIYKIYKWLSGDKDGTGDATSAAAKVEAKIETVTQMNAAVPVVAEGMLDAGRELHNNPITFQGAKGGPVHFSSMDQLIDSVFLDEARYGEEKKFFLKPDPIHRDIVEHGPYSQLFTDIAHNKVFSKVGTLITERIKLLNEIEHADRNAQGTVVPGVNNDLDNIGKPIMLKLHGKDITLMELANLLRMEHEKASAKKSDQRIHYDDMFNKLTKVYENKEVLSLLQEITQFMPIMSHMQDALQKTQNIIGDLSQDGAAGGNSPQVAQRIRATISLLNQQVSGFAALSNEIDHYINYLKSLSSTTVGFAKEIVRKTVLLMKLNEVTEIPIEWRKVRAGIDGALKAMEATHYPTGFHNHRSGRFSLSEN